MWDRSRELNKVFKSIKEHKKKSKKMSKAILKQIVNNPFLRALIVKQLKNYGDKLLKISNMNFVFLPMGKLYKKAEKKKLKFYRNLADSVIRFLGSDI